MIFPWGDARRFNAYNRFIRARFGRRMQKLTLDAGFTCPNRDGRCGTGGCTYCLNDAFNPAYCTPQKSITQQIDDGIAFHLHRRPARSSGSTGYLAYFQAYSNTYAPLDRLQELYEEALAHPAIEGLIIATRPDCIDEPLLDYLETLQQRSYISLEIGIESLHDKTLQRIHRGHTMECTEQAIEQIHRHHLPIGTHLIFGLPGETPEQWLLDVSYINRLPVQSIKFHQLQIIKGTQMEQDYLLHPEDFHLFSADEYTTFIADYLERLRPDITVERFASEVPPKYLATSGWKNMKYDQILQQIEEKLNMRDSWQGKFEIIGVR